MGNLIEEYREESKEDKVVAFYFNDHSHKLLGVGYSNFLR